MKRILTIIISIIIILVLIVTFYWYFIFPFVPIKTSLAFPLIRKQWDKMVIGHFPENIGKESEVLGFYFSPGAMQASTIMEIRLQYNIDNYNKELIRLRKLPITPDAKKFTEIYNGYNFMTFEGDTQKFKIHVLHCKPTFYNNEPSWNHGSSYGYAYNNEKKEIIYWAESW